MAQTGNKPLYAVMRTDVDGEHQLYMSVYTDKKALREMIRVWNARKTTDVAMYSIVRLGETETVIG